MEAAFLTTPKVPHDPTKALCELVERRCGFRIPKATMEAMFMSDWTKLSLFAHAIHNEQQRRLSAPLSQDAYRGPL